MSLLRTSTNVFARATRQQGAALTSIRGYADGPGRAEGATAGSKGWKEKEQAHENQYFREAEKEKLKKLKDSIQKQRDHLAEVEKHIESLEKK